MISEEISNNSNSKLGERLHRLSVSPSKDIVNNKSEQHSVSDSDEQEEVKESKGKCFLYDNIQAGFVFI